MWGYPHGYGIMQMDPPPEVNSSWNWRQNLTAGIAKIQCLSGPAYSFWTSQVQQWELWNVDRQSHGLSAVPAPLDQPESANCTFTIALDSNGNTTQSTGKDKTYWFGDTILIKRYNGANPDSITWDTITDPSAPHWSFNKRNVTSLNYVYDVCTCNVPGDGCQHTKP